jgi:dipeptidyl aminopeptidase/acylaminoacyl peptidase
MRGHRAPAFDHARLAEELGKATNTTVVADRLPFSEIELARDRKTLMFESLGKSWKCDLATYRLEVSGTAQKNEPAAEVMDGEEDRQSPDFESPRYTNSGLIQRRRRASSIQVSPDGKFEASIEAQNIQIRLKEGGKIVMQSRAGVPGNAFAAMSWSPDSKHLVGIRLAPGDRKDVYLVESSPKSGGRAVLKQRVYDQPGDRLDTFDLWSLDPEKSTETKIEMEPVDTGDQPDIRWRRDPNFFTYEKTDRGHGRFRIIESDTTTGRTRNLVDHVAKTFIDITSDWDYYCTQTDEILWRSEKDGWGHLYLVDGKTGSIENQITTGNWVVRGVDKVDEKARQVWFHASGQNPGEDPYLLYYYRINFDGSGLTTLTEGNGNHSIAFSPTSKFYIDTYSRVDEEPTFELRRSADGHLISRFDRAEISLLKSIGWKFPQVFVAKARDAKTDIWGVVYRPSNFDPTKKYPIIENIYAGPQDSFVPKTFAPTNRMQQLAELGFIVVQIDGMGTRNRSKAFHDVCWKNLADAGLPDRILWMKALAAKDPSVDLDRVGVYGTSAGGQNSTGALLFHPEFYKVAVSCAGCHDNRMDKVWWNEQWMGYPTGPWYAEQSNITNAGKLKGKLLLMVGELDTNVPPESTLRLVDALIKANKEFQMLVLPGFDHTDGGPYGERKRRDFFVHNLLGVEPPERN